MQIEKVLTLLLQAPGGWTQARQDKLANCPDDATLVVVGDERTGERYGNAKCRAGRCVKIGTGGKNKTSLIKPYQLWAVWD